MLQTTPYVYMYSAQGHFLSNLLPILVKARARPVSTRITDILQQNTCGKTECGQPTTKVTVPSMLFQNPDITLLIKSCLTTPPPRLTRRRPRNHNLERNIPAPTERRIWAEMLRRRRRQYGRTISRMLATALRTRASRALWAVGTGIGWWWLLLLLLLLLR
jgi:hypothetical protein